MKSYQDSGKVKRVLPFILATAIFMQMLDSTILNTSLPAIARDLNEAVVDMHMAIVSYVLTVALLMPVSGFLADRYGTRRVFIAALALFALGSLACSMAQNLTQLVLARVLQGMGGSLMIPVGKLALIKAFPKHEFLKAINYAIIPALIGPILGPLVGGYMVDYLSWHWIFLINLPIALGGIVLSLYYLPDYRATFAKFDFKGFLLFGTASFLLSASLELLSNSLRLTPILLTLLVGLALLYAYYRHARRQAYALFPLNLFQVRTFRIGILGGLATRLGISSVPLLLPLMIQLAYKQSAVVSGWMVAPMALTAMLSKSMVVRILNRWGYRRVLVVNTLIIGLLICSFALPGAQASIYWHLPLIALLGFFNSIQFTSMNTISVADLRPYHTSSGNSLVSVNQQLAIGFGVAFGLVVLKSMEQQTWLTGNDTHAAFRYTFLIIGCLTMLSAWVFSQLHERDGQNLKTSPSGTTA
ncbi:MAG: MFS transporter [Thermonema sp.]|uniref:MFS transporter n=1 Tax=Thermonema sp. TaxID=2231181 RepID=UPI0021DC1ACC|nr:MFS transporter [Thermonema sp.]GIV39367.1 MAG: MFS transporter [Thermonema sp.]